MTQQRYSWQKPSDLPDRVELVDSIAKCIVAVVTSVGRDWTWNRSTSVLLHGAPPTAGNCRSLTEAKLKVLDGLP